MSNPGQEFEQSALASAVPANDADDLALLHVERHVAERLDNLFLFRLASSQLREGPYDDFPKLRVCRIFAEAIAL